LREEYERLYNCGRYECAEIWPNHRNFEL
jgi:hypothetical protein